jgi:aspartokinase-like uncharacterized kinase
MRPAVVKLGGSTADQPELQDWIEALAGASFPLVIVPGGGPFADAVRAAQGGLGFSDSAAHAMAILAMEQFGHLILDRDNQLIPARTLADIERARHSGRSSVWLPSTLALAAAELEQSWNVTSDSLAAWLAGTLGADRLALIKQSDDFGENDSVVSLAARGLVDAAFSHMLSHRIVLHVAGPRHLPDAAARLGSGALPGLRIPNAAPDLRRVG